MADSIKTDYMDQPTIGYSEYLFLDAAALNAQSPKPGDRAIVLAEGKVYFCINQGEWLLFGESGPTPPTPPTPTYDNWESLKTTTWQAISTYSWNQLN